MGRTNQSPAASRAARALKLVVYLAPLVMGVLACDAPGAADAGGGARDVVVAPEAAASAVVDAGVEEDAEADADAAVDLDALAARGITMIEEVSVIIHGDLADCDKMGADLDAYYKKNGDLVDAMRETYMKMPRDQRKPIQVRYRTRFDTAWKRLQPGLKKCKDQPSVKELVRKGS